MESGHQKNGYTLEQEEMAEVIPKYALLSGVMKEERVKLTDGQTQEIDLIQTFDSRMIIGHLQSNPDITLLALSREP